MIADSVAFLTGAGPAGDGRHRALLRRLQAQPRVQPAGARGRRRQGCVARRAVRHQRRLAAARGRAASSPTCTATSATTSSSASTATTTPGCAVANSMAAVRAGARHVQGTLNGLGERTGNCNLTTVIPNLQLKLGMPLPARGPPRAAHRGQQPRGRGAQPAAQPAGAVRRLVGVRPQGRPARDARSSGRRTPTSTSTPSSSATARASSCQRDGGPGDDPDEGRRARPRRWTARPSTRSSTT